MRQEWFTWACTCWHGAPGPAFHVGRGVNSRPVKQQHINRGPLHQDTPTCTPSVGARWYKLAMVFACSERLVVSFLSAHICATLSVSTLLGSLYARALRLKWWPLNSSPTWDSMALLRLMHVKASSRMASRVEYSASKNSLGDR